jgi:hypothetical protein
MEKRTLERGTLFQAGKRKINTFLGSGLCTVLSAVQNLSIKILVVPIERVPLSRGELFSKLEKEKYIFWAVHKSFLYQLWALPGSGR